MPHTALITSIIQIHAIASVTGLSPDVVTVATDLASQSPNGLSYAHACGIILEDANLLSDALARWHRTGEYGDIRLATDLAAQSLNRETGEVLLAIAGRDGDDMRVRAVLKARSLLAFPHADLAPASEVADEDLVRLEERFSECTETCVESAIAAVEEAALDWQERGRPSFDSLDDEDAEEWLWPLLDLMDCRESDELVPVVLRVLERMPLQGNRDAALHRSVLEKLQWHIGPIDIDVPNIAALRRVRDEVIGDCRGIRPTDRQSYGVARIRRCDANLADGVKVDTFVACLARKMRSGDAVEAYWATLAARTILKIDEGDEILPLPRMSGSSDVTEFVRRWNDGVMAWYGLLASTGRLVWTNGHVVMRQSDP